MFGNHVGHGETRELEEKRAEHKANDDEHRVVDEYSRERDGKQVAFDFLEAAQLARIVGCHDARHKEHYDAREQPHSKCSSIIIKLTFQEKLKNKNKKKQASLFKN